MSAPSGSASTDPRELIAALHALRDDLQAMARAQQVEIQQLHEQTAAEQEEFARKARSGEYGREWQTVQRRVDLGETTAAAVVRGEDDSPQAAEIRRTMHAHVDDLDNWEEAQETASNRLLPEDVDPVPGRAEARDVAEQVRRQLEVLLSLRPAP